MENRKPKSSPAEVLGHLLIGIGGLAIVYLIIVAAYHLCNAFHLLG